MLLTMMKEPPTFHSDGHGVMLCLAVPPDVAHKIKQLQDGPAVPIEEMHITLLYFGDADEVPKEDRLKLSIAVVNVCREHPPLDVRIGGVGVFPPNESNGQRYVTYASIDSVGLSELRTDLTRAVERICPPKKTHGFTPHLTLGYSKEEPELPDLSDMTDLTWTAKKLTLVIEHAVIDYAFEGVAKAKLIFDLAKAKTGEGSRGGKILGHTKSGKPIYAHGDGVLRRVDEADIRNRSDVLDEETLTQAQHAHHRLKYTKADHQDAEELHQIASNDAAQDDRDDLSTWHMHMANLHGEAALPLKERTELGRKATDKQAYEEHYSWSPADASSVVVEKRQPTKKPTARKKKSMLIFDLVKGRPRGSKNANHQYLVRLELPPGADGKPRYFRVYPDPEDVASFDPKTGYKLTNGKTVTKVISEALYGDYGVDKNGKPWVKDGLLYTYKPTFTNAAFLKEKRQYGEPINVEKLGKWRFYKFKRIPGFLDYDLGPGVARQWTAPAKFKDFHLTDPTAIAEATARVPGASQGFTIQDRKGRKTFVAGVPEGQPRPADDAPPPGYVHDSPPVGEIDIHVAPTQPASTAAVVREPLPDKIDPLEHVKEMIDGATAKPGIKAKVTPLPEWAIDKFDNEQDLIDRLYNEPATTLVTLGKHNPKNAKVQDHLSSEWGGIIRRLAKKAFDAFKVTGMHDWYEQQGGDKGIREYRRQVMHDLIGHGSEELMQIAQDYRASKDPENRFDKVAYTAIKRHIWRESQKMIRAYKEEGAYIPIVHEIDEEAAAYQAARKVPLTADEAYELETLAPQAQELLYRVVATLPANERSLFFRRLWLDDPVGEVAARNARKMDDHTGRGTDEPVLTIDDLIENVNEGHWQRPFTGKIGIVQDYGGRHQNTVIKEAREAVSAARKRILASFSRKDPDTGERRYTREGKIVKRWLELEAKMSGGNRQLFRDRVEHTDITVPADRLADAAPERATVDRELLIPATSRLAAGEGDRPAAGVKVRRAGVTTPAVETPRHMAPQRNAATGHAAVGYFAKNPALARELGINLRAIDPSGTGGVYRTPHLANLGSFADSHIDLAERYHKLLTEAQTKPPAEIHTRIAELQSVKSTGSALPAFHDAMVSYGKLIGAKKARVAEARRLKAEFKQNPQRVARGSVALPIKNPFPKKDAVAREAYVHVASKMPRTEQDLDDAIQSYIHTTYPGEYDHPKSYRAFHQGLKDHFTNHGGVVIKTAKEELSERLAALKPSPAEEQEIVDAHAKIPPAGVALGAHPAGADVVAAYMAALQRGDVHYENMATHEATLSQGDKAIAAELALLQHALKQRVDKALPLLYFGSL